MWPPQKNNLILAFAYFLLFISPAPQIPNQLPGVSGKEWNVQPGLIWLMQALQQSRFCLTPMEAVTVFDREGLSHPLVSQEMSIFINYAHIGQGAVA